MTFRIKSNYVFIANMLDNGNWSNENPELSLSKCDDIYLRNKVNSLDQTLYIQPDRIKFCNIFNLIEQNVSFTWFVGEESNKKTFSIKKGIYSSKQLQDTLNAFDNRIEFTFNNVKDLNGELTVKNKETETDITITMNKNLILITGLIDIYSLLSINATYLEVPCKRNFTIKSHFDMSRTIKEIKLYSKYVFDYKTELCCNTFSAKELKCLNNNKVNFFDTEITSSHLSSKVQKVDRFNMQSCKFYFLDFFDEPVYFDFCELVIFIANK